MSLAKHAQRCWIDRTGIHGRQQGRRAMPSTIRPHNARVAATWDTGGADYDAISRAIADAIEHCLNRLDPRPGERVLDLATGTGWTARQVAARGAEVVGVDIGANLIEAARTL